MPEPEPFPTPRSPRVVLERILLREHCAPNTVDYYGQNALEQMDKYLADGFAEVRIDIDCEMRKWVANQGGLVHECDVDDKGFACHTVKEYQIPFAVKDVKHGVWLYDGNAAAPTLSPSYKATHQVPAWTSVLHLYIQSGAINLLSDSALTLADGRVIPMVMG